MACRVGGGFALVGLGRAEDGGDAELCAAARVEVVGVLELELLGRPAEASISRYRSRRRCK